MPITHPVSPAFASAAEQVVWERLRAQLPDSAVLIAGQRVTADGEEIEADLLVLWPGVGIAVIEVKGGRVSLHEGHWYQGDRSGQHVLRTSPIIQAQRAKHRIIAYLNDTSSRPIGRAAHLAVLPYTELPATWDVPDAPRALILDATDLPRLAERIVHALNSQTSVRYAPLDEQQCQHAVRMLRRSHRAIENHQLLAREIADEGNALTREQERAIALLRFQHRAQIVGGAGSGKTHLAMIKARTLAREGFRTALLCYSRGLARHFQLLSATWPDAERPAYVGLFHDLPVRWGAETEDRFDGTPVAYYEEHLPRRLAELAAEQEPQALFDAIVVDEAQDFADIWWDGLQLCLRDPDEGCCSCSPTSTRPSSTARAAPRSPSTRSRSTTICATPARSPAPSPRSPRSSRGRGWARAPRCASSRRRPTARWRRPMTWSSASSARAGGPGRSRC